MTAVTERVRAVTQRMARRRAERRAAAPERAQRKTEAEARRLEHRRKAFPSGGDGGGAA